MLMIFGQKIKTQEQQNKKAIIKILARARNGTSATETTEGVE